VQTVVAIVLAAISTLLQNAAYLREHDASAALPPLSLRRPVHSLQLVLASRAWLRGFAMECGGFACYAGAVALASLALVQTIGAGGVGVLAFAGARLHGRRLAPRARIGVGLSVLGLIALGVSLVGSSGQDGHGALTGILGWMAGCGLMAALALVVGLERGTPAVADGIAGGLLFSIGDLSTKIATQGGARFAFAITLVLGYLLGTSLLQVGYQRGTALTVAGLASLLTNALPIIAGTVVLHEPVPTGALGVARVAAFVLVIAGAVLLSEGDPETEQNAVSVFSTK
jgi:hypothetical protein